MDTSTGTRSIAIPNLVEMVVASTRLLGALSDLTDEDVRAASLLPGWSRGHVVTHLARNADAFCNLLHWAETGEPHYMYPSREQRDADIEAGAGRSAHDLRVDASAACGRLIQAINELDVRHEDNLVAQAPGRPTFPARDIPTRRLIEVQVHHADLGIGYTNDDWDNAFCELLLDRVAHDRTDGPSMLLRATDTGREWKYGVEGPGPVVSGPACDLAWWAMARGDGEGLTSDTELPALSKWR
ncbi:maleylpyruvate isomerase family mycothiol-dependent enzyme [Nocardioides pakistanensis]